MENTMTDLQLKAQEAILNDSRTKEQGIEALEDGGVITLKGNVPSRDISEAAESIVEELMDVVGVINELDVEVKHLDDAFENAFKEKVG